MAVKNLLFAMDFDRNIRKEIKNLRECMANYANFVNGGSFANSDRFAGLCHSIMELMSNLEGTKKDRIKYSNFLNKMIADISEEKFYDRLIGLKAGEKIKIPWIVYYFFGGFLSWEHKEDAEYPLDEKPEMSDFGRAVFRGLDSVSVKFIIQQAFEDGNRLHGIIKYHLHLLLGAAYITVLNDKNLLDNEMIESIKELMGNFCL